MSVKSGALEPLKLFKIFRSLLDRQTSGELVLTRGQVVKKVRLQDGRPVRALTNVRRETVVGALQEQGVLDDPRLVAVQKLREEKGISGERALVELGLLTPQRLKTLEGQLVRRRLLETFGWRDGTFTFAERVPDGEDEGLVDPIDPIELLLEAAARVVRQEDCLQFVSAYPAQVIRLTEWNRTYGALFDRLFGQSNVRLLLVRPLTFDDLAREIGDDQRTARQIFGLVIGGLGLFGAATGQTVATATPPRPTEAAPKPSVAPAAPAPRPDASAPRPPVQVSRSVAVGFHAEVTAATPAPELGGPTPPPPAPLRGTPPAGARPAEISPATPAPEAPPRGRPVALRGSTQPGTAAPPRPDSSSVTPSSPAASTPIGGPSPRPSAPAPPAAARPATPPSELPERQRRTLAEIDTLARELQSRNHYELLAVEPKVDAAKIRARFRHLARDYHVDRFARYGLAEDVMKRIGKVFMALNRAHEVLTDPEQRKEYDLSLELTAKGHVLSPQGGVDAAGVFKSEQLVRDGTMAVKNNNPKLAKQKFELALEKNPMEPVARAGLAFADFMVAQGQGGSVTMAARARDVIEQIATPDLAREEPFIYLGRVYRILGEGDKAIRAFERAIEINRHCAEAASELRHLQRKAEEAGPAKKGGGLFSKKK